MATETLTCQYEPKPHKWTRELTRGRKPPYCPKHKPASTVTVNSSPGQPVELTCEIGQHKWLREPQRGAKPRNCPQHKPVHVAQADSAGNGIQVLPCEIGKHNWERPIQRGAKPRNCPAHAVSVQGVSGPRTVNVRIISDAFPVQEIAEDELPIVEVEGEYESETTEQEQRELLTAAFKSPPKKRGRPRIHETPEEAEQAALARSRAKVDALEANLRAHGTHISQQAPYSLYKLTSGEAGTETAHYDYVRLFSPLARQQFMNQFPERFEAGIYYFTKDGERVED